MRTKGTASREVAVPVEALVVLRRELAREVGATVTVEVLHHAGYQAGLHAAASLHAAAGGDATLASEADFWRTLTSFFVKRGWGTLTHTPAHAGVGLLSSPDWAEVGEQGSADEDGSCSFSAGFLAGLLSHVAGGPVAVLEVTCRTRGAPSCVFAFGSEDVINGLYGQLLRGADLHGALAAL